MVESIKTVETPAPTAASVKATSTASMITKSIADTKLKAPDNIITANRWFSVKAIIAIETKITKKHMIINNSIFLIPSFFYILALQRLR